MKVVTSHQCVGCDQYKADRHLESVVIGDETLYACETCVDALEGPGKHEAVDESDRALCVVLEYLAGISMEDYMLTDDWQGYVGVFGKYLLLEDGRGFVEVRELADSDAAMREVNGFEDDGFGADESDAWISSERNGYSVSFDGKYIDTYPRLNRAMAKVSLLMRDSGYYPNVFLAGEHGPSVRRIDVRYLAERKA
jgi:hypothetical protein